MYKMKNKEETNWRKKFIEFTLTYFWAILSAVIVIGVLAYFGVFNFSSYNKYECFAKSFCKNQTLEYETYQHYENNLDIYCKRYLLQNISWIINFRTYNIKELEKLFPECVKNDILPHHK